MLFVMEGSVGHMIRAFDMFCGAGGSSRGAALAGVHIVGGIDSWELATQVFSDNFPDAHVYASTVDAIDPARISKDVGKVDLLLASPECTNHSCARGARPRDDASRDTAFEIVRYARTLRPRWVIIENVVHMRPWSRYRELLDQLQAEQYQLNPIIADASDYGVPQRRRRLFLVCDREAKPPKRIRKSPGPKPAAAGVLDKQGIWRCSPLDNGRRASNTLNRAARAVAELGDDRRFLIVYYGNDGAGGWQPVTVPLRTITTLDRFGLCEPSDDGLTLRMLQVPELMRAMGDSFDLSRGTRREKIMMLGNGVCPPVMAAVVRALTGGNRVHSASTSS